jgi:hypothetical protein
LNKVVKAGIGGLLCLSPAAHAVERFGAFHSDIRIAASGELAVTETIELQSAGRAAPRGIVRELAEDYRDRVGGRVKVPLAVDQVLRNGWPEPYELERVANGVRIRTGEPGRALPRGKHAYQITYRTARQVSFFEEHDELYWEVGRNLDATVERLSAEVSFERPVPASAIKAEASTGAQGAQSGAHSAQGQDYHAFVREGAAAFRATRPLTARENMAIVVAFPKGVVERPSQLERSAWYLATNRGVLVGAAVLALMLAFLLACRWRFARVAPPAALRAAPPEALRAAPPEALRATPPEGVGPGAVRFIDRGGYDERCLSAAILGLQSRGYLRVREHGERLRLERTGEALEWLPGEQALARRLVRERPAEIRRQGRTLEEAGRRLAADLHEAFGRRRWASHAPFIFVAAGIGLAGVAAMRALDTPPAAFAVIAGAMALCLALFACTLLPVLSPRGREHQQAIDALRQHLSAAEPQSEEEFARLLPYAVALELEQAWGRRFAERVPANIVELTPRAPDKAPARPRRPLRHTRSAAA